MARWQSPLVAVAAASLALTALVWRAATQRLPGHPLWLDGGDHLLYIKMARAPDLLDAGVSAPQAYRLLVPGIVRLLPLDTQTAFVAVAVAALAVTGVIVWYLGRHAANGADAGGWLGLLLYFGLHNGPHLHAFNFWHPDPVAHAFLAGAVLASVTGRHWPSVLLVALGVTAKESVLFVAPLWYSLHARRWWDGRLAVRTALSAIPALVAIVTVRAVVSAPSAPGYGERFADVFLSQNLPALTAPLAASFVLWTFGVGPLLLAVAGGHAATRAALRWSPLLVAAFAQYLFAVSTYRLFIIAFPAIIVLAVAGGETWRGRTRAQPWLLPVVAATWVVVDLAGPTVGVGADDVAVVLAVQVATLAAVWWLVRGRPSGDRNVTADSN